MTRLVLYSKPGCHLCDEMKKVIEAVAARVPLTVEVVDISTDQALMDRFGLEIPVLTIGERKIAKHWITEQELEEKLRRRKGAG